MLEQKLCPRYSGVVFVLFWDICKYSYILHYPQFSPYNSEIMNSSPLYKMKVDNIYFKMHYSHFKFIQKNHLHWRCFLTFPELKFLIRFPDINKKTFTPFYPINNSGYSTPSLPTYPTTHSSPLPNRSLFILFIVRKVVNNVREIPLLLYINIKTIYIFA